MVKKFCCYKIFFFCIFFVSGQKNGQFLYSMFGWGEPVPFRFHHQNIMGGTAAALLPDTLFPSLLNTEQSASLSDIRFATLDVGGSHRFNKYESGTLKSEYYSLSRFDYASLGIPLGKKGGFCLGIAPYTTRGYSLQTQYYETGVGDMTVLQVGDGGLNQAYAGAGFQPFKYSLIHYMRKTAGDSVKNFSFGRYYFYKWLSQIRIGIRTAWMFGQITDYTDIRYPSNVLYYNHFREQTYRPMGIMPSLSVMSAWIQDSIRGRALKEKNFYTVGMVWYPSVTLPAIHEVYSYNYYSTSVSVQRKDSSEKLEKSGERFRLPQRFLVGAGYKKGYRWTAAMDLEYTRWSKASPLISFVSPSDALNLGAGFSWVPDKFAYGKQSYFQRVRYAAGVRYCRGYITLNQSTMEQWAFSGGLSLPIGIRTGTGLLHLGVQVYQNSSDPNYFYTEKGIRLMLGITFNSTYFEDYWFRKFKYD